MEAITCCVKFDWSLVTEATNERVGRASPAQVARSYSAGNPTVTVKHTAKWLAKNCPVYFERFCR